jgi:hypothetical protein
MRIAAWLVFVSCGVSVLTADAIACGDKYNRIGRFAPFGRYVAVHRASILIYAPKNSVPARADLSSVLKKAGHHPVVLSDSAQLAEAMASGKFDLVLAGLKDAQGLAAATVNTASSPGIVPVLLSATKAEVAAAMELSSCLLDLQASRNDALAEIDHRMELRLASAGSSR